MSKIRKLFGLGIVVVIIGALLYYAPTIISFVQNPSSSGSSYNPPFTSLTFRDGINGTVTLDFGDTEYNFEYLMGAFTVSTFIESGYKLYTPNNGDVYKVWGIEIDVSKVASDYISNYIVFKVKPTVQNYMASLHFTEVNLTLNEPRWVNISSGLVNETHQYVFTYTKVTYVSSYQPYLRIGNGTQEGNPSEAYASGSYAWSTDIKEFNIEATVFKTDSQYMVIYVKPLY